jgi:alpha-glucuronidase
VVATVEKMLMQSWPAYEHYTGPLGTQTLTDITGSHYGPNIEASERNGWGQWHRDDAQGIGMDRTVATGTGYIGQYPPQDCAQVYESLQPLALTICSCSSITCRTPTSCTPARR